MAVSAEAGQQSFLPLVSIAKKFCECLTNAGMKAVEVDGGSPDRKEILDGFNAGKYDVICNAYAAD